MEMRNLRGCQNLGGFCFNHSFYADQVDCHSREGGNPETNNWTPAFAGVTLRNTN
jgi:hypothetical protein